MASLVKEDLNSEDPVTDPAVNLVLPSHPEITVTIPTPDSEQGGTIPETRAEVKAEIYPDFPKENEDPIPGSSRDMNETSQKEKAIEGQGKINKGFVSEPEDEDEPPQYVPITPISSSPPLPLVEGNNNGFAVPVVGLDNYVKKPSDANVETGNGGEDDRMTWDNQWEFLFSCISMSVGLGNVWRFPVTAYENGGGAFLIPYFVVLIFVGRPIYFLELCLGQFTSYSQVQVWKCAPFFKGVGFGTMVAALCVLTYYCSILALAVFYLVMSFQKNLPWAHCDVNWAGAGNCNETRLIDNITQTVPEMYFQKEVLKEYADIDDGIGPPDWKLGLCLLASWVLIYGTIMKGVKSSGKVAYFTAIFPYVVLLILLVRGVTLPGAWTGIRYFIEPKWEKLYEPGVWYAAVTQCFFSLNTGFGSIIMFSSYNPFHHNIYRDSLVVSFMDTFTSLLAGFTIFAILGNLAHETGNDVSDVVQGGASLAFISYPDAIAKLDVVPQLFAVLFFMMLFTLGVGSAAADAGAIASIFCDRYPVLKRWMVTGVICIFGFAVGLIYVTPGGQWMLDLVDFYGGGFVIYTMCTLEMIGVAWIYGLYNFINDMEFMLGRRLGWYWKICWGLIIPIFLTIILIYSLVVDGNLQHNEMDYPVAATVCGWIIAAIALGCFPVGGFHAMSKTSEKSWLEQLKRSVLPKYDWGPRNVKKREEWKEFISHQDTRTFRQRLRDRSGL